MQEWLKITFVAVSSVILVLIVITIIKRRCCPRKSRDQSNSSKTQNLQNGISKLHHHHHHHHHHVSSLHHLERDGTKKNNYYVFKQGFNWSDHPSLVTDAVENGWSRFAFTNFATSPSVRSSARSILGSCGGVGENESGFFEVDMRWEICQDSSDFMQKIRFNSGAKKLNKSCKYMSASSVVRTSLPLPGPHLGNSSFPQESYFEITILPWNQEGNNLEIMRKSKEDKLDLEKIKLIREDSSNSKANSESLVHVTSSSHHRVNGHIKSQESKESDQFILLSIGLTSGGSLPLKLPGSYPGSIGFNSNGSVFLDGMKLVFESHREEWGKAEKIIGCGYNPSQKKVFFTVDSLLVHEILCKTEEFGSPLYPTLASNGDILVVVNLGQSAFKYPPANLQRTSNPCFIGSIMENGSPILGYEDSKELFSMGRIDAQWLNRSNTRSNNNTVNSLKQVLDYDLESEGDLFEIVLDNSSSYSRSPNPL